MYATAEKAAQKAAVYRNRARRLTQYGKRLRKRRAEFCERGFAHLCGSGGLRRVWLRGLDNVRKRYEIHCAGFNLGLLMRHLTGLGTPRGLQSASAATLAAFAALFLATIRHLLATIRHLTAIRQSPLPIHRPVCHRPFVFDPMAGTQYNRLKSTASYTARFALAFAAFGRFCLANAKIAGFAAAVPVANGVVSAGVG